MHRKTAYTRGREREKREGEPPPAEVLRTFIDKPVRPRRVREERGELGGGGSADQPYQKENQKVLVLSTT